MSGTSSLQLDGSEVEYMQNWGEIFDLKITTRIRLRANFEAPHFTSAPRLAATDGVNASGSNWPAAGFFFFPRNSTQDGGITSMIRLIP